MHVMMYYMLRFLLSVRYDRSLLARSQELGDASMGASKRYLIHTHCMYALTTSDLFASSVSTHDSPYVEVVRYRIVSYSRESDIDIEIAGAKTCAKHVVGPSGDVGYTL